MRLLGYVDCLSRVPGDWYARFCGEEVIATGLNLRVSPHDGFSLLALSVVSAPALDDTQELGMLSQKLHQLICFTTLYCTTIVVKGPKDHLHRDPFQRFAQD